jgi:PAS domain-containing protein
VSTRPKDRTLGGATSSNVGTTPQFRGDRGVVQLVDLLEFAIEQANDGIAIMRFTGDPQLPIRIVYANATIERLSGFTRRELLEPSNPFLRVQPQNRARYDRLFAQVREGIPVRFEIALTGKDRATWTEIRWSPLQYAGKEVTHYVAVLREHVAELAHEGLCIVEIPEGAERQPRVLHVNDAMSDMLQTPPERIWQDQLAGALDLRNVLGGETLERELCVEREDGTSRRVTVTASPACDESGRIERVVITSRESHTDAHKTSDVGTMLALSAQIRRLKDVEARRDAFLEVLRTEFGIRAAFSRAHRPLDLVLRVKDHNGYMVMPEGVLFDRAVAIDFSWSDTLTPRRLTALRIFLETLAEYE